MVILVGGVGEGQERHTYFSAAGVTERLDPVTQGGVYMQMAASG